MPNGRIRAMAVGVRRAMTVDWIALTTGIVGTGIAMIALVIILERDADPGAVPDCPSGAELTDASCLD